MMNEHYQIVPRPARPSDTPGGTYALEALAAADEGAGLDLAGIVDAFLRRWWIPALLAALGGGLAVLYGVLAKPVYESRATVEVAQGRPNVLNIEELKPEDLNNLEILKTIEQNLASSSLVLRVVEACGLRGDPDFQAPGGGSHGDAMIADIVGGMIAVDLRRGTRLIDIVVKDTDPERARRIAAAVVEEFERAQIEDVKNFATDTHGSLAAEAERLQRELDASEAKLLAYREQHRTVTLEGKESVLEEKSKALNGELAKTKAERMRLEADLEQLDDDALRIAPEGTLALPSVAARPEIVALRGKVAAKESEFAMVKKRYKHLHPTYIQVQGELDELRAALDREAQLAAAGLRNTRDALGQKESKLETELASGREELLELARILVPYRAMLRDVEADRVLYEGVRTRQKEAVASAALERGAIALKDAPLAAVRPIWPRSKLLVALGLAAGLAVGCGMVLAGHLFDNKFRTEAQAERILAIPPIATIPAAEIAFGNAGEAFRSLRTSLSFLGGAEGAKSFLFTSARMGEDAPACAANAAVAFARQGHRTLLIDSNLRSPEVDAIVLGRHVTVGLGQYLGGDDTAQVVSPTSVENLFLLGAGAAVGNAGELLSGQRLEGLMTDSRQWFGRIVVSAPGVGEISDGLMLARFADAVCLVIEAGATPRRDVLRACRLLRMAGAAPVGFIFMGGKNNNLRMRNVRARPRAPGAILQEA